MNMTFADRCREIAAAIKAGRAFIDMKDTFDGSLSRRRVVQLNPRGSVSVKAARLEPRGDDRDVVTYRSMEFALHKIETV